MFKGEKIVEGMLFGRISSDQGTVPFGSGDGSFIH